MICLKSEAKLDSWELQKALPPKILLKIIQYGSAPKMLGHVPRAVARVVKLGGASSQFADWWAWLWNVAFLSHTHTPC